MKFISIFKDWQEKILQSLKAPQAGYADIIPATSIHSVLVGTEAPKVSYKIN